MPSYKNATQGTANAAYGAHKPYTKRDTFKDKEQNL